MSCTTTLHLVASMAWAGRHARERGSDTTRGTNRGGVAHGVRLRTCRSGACVLCLILLVLLWRVDDSDARGTCVLCGGPEARPR